MDTYTGTKNDRRAAEVGSGAMIYTPSFIKTGPYRHTERMEIA
jgi:hypothetical protein